MPLQVGGARDSYYSLVCWDLLPTVFATGERIRVEGVPRDLLVRFGVVDYVMLVGSALSEDIDGANLAVERCYRVHGV